jgi:hypothetical protein
MKLMGSDVKRRSANEVEVASDLHRPEREGGAASLARGAPAAFWLLGQDSNLQPFG